MLLLLVQLAVIILAARLGGWLFRRFGQPRVVGEILAGLLLGPSCLGSLYPEGLHLLFPAESEPTLRTLGQLGLILLMFEVGLEFDFVHLRQTGRSAAAVALAGICLPFLMGVLVAAAMRPSVAPDQGLLGFALFVATTLSITAIPILGRIMIEFDLQRTPVGVLTISAAAVDDALGWILLAGVSSIVTGQLNPVAIAGQLGMLVAFVGVSMVALRPAILWWLRPADDGSLARSDEEVLSVMLLLAFAMAMVTNMIGVFSVFGPFVLGACLSDQPGVRGVMQRRLHEFLGTFFLPVFFTFTGLRTNVGSLDTLELWGWCALITLAATVGKMVGCGLMARLGGSSWTEAAMVAVMMNTRALMGLVAINIGRELGVIPETVFTMLVLMAVVTTVVTVPVLRVLLAAGPEQAAAIPVREPAQLPV